ncbi:MAG: hypothetical protein H0Z40_08940 [Desulfotomaculum sp.]|nr:hypothetical protein [Desulfotomaculum sp.]
MKTILVYDISSIGESIFSLKSRSGVIKDYSFECKQKPEKKSASSYNFDREDLIKIN